MNNGLFTYLAALLLFGSNGIIAAAIALPSSDIVLLRTFLGALSLVTILAITQRHKLQAPSRPREAAALLLSGAALGASWIFLFRAYQTIGVGVSSLLYYCGPIIVMALSPLIFGEKLTGGKIAGFIAVACGAFLIAAQGLGGNMPIAGIACGIASAFCYALMVIASKGAPHIEGLENSTLQVSAAFVTALVLTLITQGAPSFLSAGVAAGIDWRAVVMLGVVNTGIGCLLYFSAVAKLPVQYRRRRRLPRAAFGGRVLRRPFGRSHNTGPSDGCRAYHRRRDFLRTRRQTRKRQGWHSPDSTCLKAPVLKCYLRT